MIEVEIKLEVDEFPPADNLKFVKEKHVLDVYYDTPGYDLIKGGNFLRCRNNATIDFKTNNAGDNTHLFCTETNFDYKNFVPVGNLRALFSYMQLSLNENFNSF